MTLSEFRSESRKREDGSRRRYSESARAFAVSHARGAMGRGSRLSRVAGDLGISPMTLSVWLAKAESGVLRRVQVTEERGVREGSASGTPLRVTTASGHSVEGLTLPEAVELLRALV